MTQKQARKSIQYYVRCLHRDIGFILVGLTIIYALSGILLMYRSTGFLQSKKTIEKEVAQGLEASQLGKALGMRYFRLERQTGDTIFFNGGTYDRNSGMAVYTIQEFPPILDKFIQVHKLTSRNPLHILSVVYSVMLFFLAASSLFMYKPGTRLFVRGAYLSGAGVVMAIILMFACP